MNRTIKDLLKKIVPPKLVTLLYSIKPDIHSVDIFLLRRNELISDLQPIHEKFIVRQLTINDTEKLKAFYSKSKHILPRLKTTAWIGLAVFDTTKDKIAYVSWIIKENIPFINELGINMSEKQFMVRHGVCALEYRHQGLHTRMEQERINWCIKNGANEIFVHIGSKNIKGIGPLKKSGFEFLFKKKIISIPILGVYREINSAIKSPFKKVM